MSKFVLTAQIQLQAPKNAKQVAQQIQRQLSNVTATVNIRNGASANRTMKDLSKNTNKAADAAGKLGKSLATSIKRYAGLAIATRAVSLFTNTLGSAVSEAIDFERELVKISQVTGKTVSALRFLTNEIDSLSTSLGASSKSLIGVSRILSQAGLSARETTVALGTLARTTLAPTFDDITQTAEGAVAIFNQFRKGAEALEAQLGAVNAVAGRFAVEAGDLIGAVRRVGGVFKSAGGDLNELIALFTSVRATTRESAESISTGLRTIFTRIQRPKTIEFLRQFGVELTDLNGRFVGPFEAVKRLSSALKGLEQGDLQFIRIAEELGGFRQIGKVIPLVQQFGTAQAALNVAQQGSASLADDAAKAQQALGVRILKVKEEFLSLVRAITETKSFQIFANSALNIASALIKIADAIKPLIPLLGALGAIKLAKVGAGILGGFGGAKGFNRGGMVPGVGNRDTVPAMLTPGEFVIRKSSVDKLGVDNLAAMNKYAYGGTVKSLGTTYTSIPRTTGYKRIKDRPINDKSKFVKVDPGDKEIELWNASTFRSWGDKFEEVLAKSPRFKVGRRASGRYDYLDFPQTRSEAKFLPINARYGRGENERNAKGNTGKSIAAKNFLYENSVRAGIRNKKAQSLVTTAIANKPVTTYWAEPSEWLAKAKQAQEKEMARGGGISGPDTVPAMLTPGEFVLNSASAKRIGYSTLSRMNKVGKYNKGGIVQRFKKGGGVTGGGGMGDAGALLAIGALQSFVPTVDETSGALTRVTSTLANMATTVATAVVALNSFGFSLKANNIKNFLGAGFRNPFTQAGRAAGAARATAAGTNLAFGLERTTGLTKAAAKQRYGFLRKQGGFTKDQAIQITRTEASSGALFSKNTKGVSAGLKASSKGLRIFSQVLSRVTGPILALTAISKVIGAFRDLEGQLNDAIKAGDTAKAQTLAVSNANAKAIPLIGDLVGGFFDLFGAGETLSGILVRFGGNTAESTKLAVKAQIDGANANKALAESAQVAQKAMEDLKNGSITAAEALRKVQDAQKPIDAFVQSSEDFAIANLENRSEIGSGAILRNILTVGGLLGETAGQRNRRLGQESATSIREGTQTQAKAFAQRQQFIFGAARSAAARGATAEQILSDTDKGPGAELAKARQQQVKALIAADKAALAGDKEAEKALRERAEQFERQAKDLEDGVKNVVEAVRRQKDAIDAMNLNLTSINAAAGAASVRLDNFLASQQLGYNPLENSLATLEASITSAAMGLDSADMQSALDTAADQIDALGADSKKFRENVSAIQEAQKNLPQTLKTVQKELKDKLGDGISEGMAPKDIKDKIASTLADSLGPNIGKEARENLVKQIQGMDLSDDQLREIAEGNLDALSSVLEEIGENALQQVLPALKKQAEIQNKINQLTQQRLDLENKYIEAQKNTLSLQAEAAKIISEFGGAVFTPEMARQNLIAQSNIDAGGISGISELRTGSAEELRKRNREVSRELAEIQALRVGQATGAQDARTQNQAGIELAGQEQRLLKLNQDQIQLTRDLIKVRQDELKQIQARNAEEKKGLEALLGGDFESFFDAQAAAGATAALATGDQALINAFGPGGVAGAFQNLQNLQQQGVQTVFGQQIGGAGGLLQQGAASALGFYGAQGQAQTLAGTTPEELAAQQEIRNLASTLPETGMIQEDQANAMLAAADMQIQAAQMQLDAAIAETDKAMGRAGGGLVYASRGMFVPRGTDTVPAMLTPGEFVVRRSAVQRGNNLQLLKAINSGGVSNTAAQSLSTGGKVRGGVQYLANGDEVVGNGFSMEGLNKISQALTTFNTQFAENINRLENTKFNITLNPTNINVNLTGASFLEDLKSGLQEKIIGYVGQELQQYTVGNNGKLTKDTMSV